MKQFCVYLTCYRGNRLPPFYIGSSNREKIDAGYRGSVSSMKYSKIWKEELLKNPSLFSTYPIGNYNTRKEALDVERRLQLRLKVVKSPMHINQAIAAPNGFFGADMKGNASPKFGKKASLETCEAMSRARKGIKTGPNKNKSRPGKLNGMCGRARSLEEKIKMSVTRSSRTQEQNKLSYTRKKSQAELKKISIAQSRNNSGSGNPRARNWKLTSPQNEVINLHGNFKTWCLKMNLPSSTTTLKFDGTMMTSGRWSGWKCERVRTTLV